MTHFCPKGHNQTGEPAMAGICPVCIRENPEEFECKDLACPDAAVKGQHFHPDKGSYFVDADGNRIGD